MEHTQLDGQLFAQMLFMGAAHLRNNAKRVDELNVFPVPDGDTGTNMNLSLTSGINELKKAPSQHLGKATQALSRGLLMGARGNSGVILSQLFRGFGAAVVEESSINSVQFANALQKGVEAAYKAVMRPVEGTILTVAKEAAKAGQAIAKKEQDLTKVMAEVLRAAKVALAKTPEQLPVLRQVGVVDSGGQGLVYVYEGFLASLRGEEEIPEEVEHPELSIHDNLAELAHLHAPVQAHLSSEDIEYGYCTEFLIDLDSERERFEEFLFRDQISQFGDSLLVISDDDLVKVHIHAEHPGEVLSFAQRYGELQGIKIENMRQQHQAILDSEGIGTSIATEAKPLKPYVLISVAAGKGLEEIFHSLGVDIIIQGGQTMNPSTEDIVNAISSVHAEKVIILPNNSNIIMAALQAKEMVDIPIEVIPTKTIPQGISALLAFDVSADLETNIENMTESLSEVKTGQITHAVRDSKFNDVEIKEGDFLGIFEGQIITSKIELEQVAYTLVDHMMTDDISVITIFNGEDAPDTLTEKLLQHIEEKYPEIEVESHYGGQPVYNYIFSVE